jgi:hypothetical protein
MKDNRNAGWVIIGILIFSLITGVLGIWQGVTSVIFIVLSIGLVIMAFPILLILLIGFGLSR